MTVHFEGYSGLTLVAQQQASLSGGGSISLALTASREQPMTKLVLRVDAPSAGAQASLQVVEIDYLGASQDFDYQGRLIRCGSMSTTRA